MSNQVRVLVVEDSALMPKPIFQILTPDSDIEVVGTAIDGAGSSRWPEGIAHAVKSLVGGARGGNIWINFQFCFAKTRGRYLMVDDSVFARKNIAKMVESFGGEIVGRPATAAWPSPSTTGLHPTWC